MPGQRLDDLRDQPVLVGGFAQPELGEGGLGERVVGDGGQLLQGGLAALLGLGERRLG
jgi:hypothetical protein